MKIQIQYWLIFLFTSVTLLSCNRTQKCECNTSSIAYDQNGSAYDKIETSSFTVKGSKSDNKTQCDIIKSNQLQGNGYTTDCEVK